MTTTAKLIQETESKLTQHLSFKGSILENKNWTEQRDFLREQLLKLKIAFYDEEIKKLEDKKAFLIKESKK